MPTLDWNKSTWGATYDWSKRGEEWSRPWGNSAAQWFGSIYPRIHRFVPCAKILEIAPGFGRWTKFLVPACQDFVGVDISEACVAHCSTQFPGARFFANDGLSLDVVDDNSIDFCFSFDSLVHAEIEVISSYVKHLMVKLSESGVAFIHHSNFKSFAGERVNPHKRAESVSLSLVADMVRLSGGRVLVGEAIDWGREGGLIDGITVFCKSSAGWGGGGVVENHGFMAEAEKCRSVLSRYCLDRAPVEPG